MNGHPILVAGGGIAGLAAAVGLARAGGDVLILERAVVLEEVGAGLQLGPNAAQGLQALGAWDAVEAVTYAPPEIHIRDGRSGSLLQRIPLGAGFTRRFGAPYRVAHRADLQAGLLSVVKQQRKIDLRLGQEVRHLLDNTTSSVKVQTPQGTVTGSCLIAADGVGSSIRQHLFPAHAAVAQPYTINRALLPDVPVVDGVAMECVNLWFLPEAHVVHYPVGRGRFNVVKVLDEPARAPQLTTALARILDHVPAWSTWQSLCVPSLPVWHEKAVCLIGDAAHGTLPFLAQGAAMALEDAVALAETDDRADPSGGFATFERLRKSRVERLDRQSRCLGGVYHAVGLKAAARNAALKFLPGSMGLRSVKWIYARASN